jgi:hypothetical protein
MAPKCSNILQVGLSELAISLRTWGQKNWVGVFPCLIESRQMNLSPSMAARSLQCRNSCSNFGFANSQQISQSVRPKNMHFGSLSRRIFFIIMADIFFAQLTVIYRSVERNNTKITKIVLHTKQVEKIFTKLATVTLKKR